MTPRLASFTYYLFVVFINFQIQSTKAEKISPSVTEFFHDIDGNLTKVTWAHAVNSAKDLNKALNTTSIMMLEADVVLGTLTTSNSTKLIPIMGHPPANTSDLSLEEFLNAVLGKNRGVKLDFKSDEVFAESQKILEKVRPNMTFPVWINADILSGPVNATGIPLNSTTFLNGANSTFPESTLSIGWTTRYGSTYNITEGSYSTAQIDEMLNVVKSNNVTQPITYPVRAGLAANSLTELQNLINGSPNGTTLTIWSSEGDDVDTKKLSTLIKTIGLNKVYVDVPDDVLEDLDLSSDSSAMKTSVIAFGALLAAVIFVRLF